MKRLRRQMDRAMRRLLLAVVLIAAAHQSGQARYATAAGGGGGGSFSAFDAPSTEVYNPDPALFTVAAAPAVFLDTRYDPQGVPLTWASDITLTDTGNPATNATNLQTAIDAASTRVGHSRIKVPEGFIANGNVRLRKHTQGAYWTYIESTEASTYAAEGARCNTSLMATAPRIRCENVTVSAIRCDQGADYTRLTGIRFYKEPSVASDIYAIIELNSTNATNDDNQTLAAHAPQWIIIDRSWVDGTNSGGVQNGIKMNTREFALVDSVVDGCYWSGTESHAVAGWNGLGPQKMVNNKLEGGSIGVLWGGAEPGITGAVYTDVEFRRNWMTRRLSWLKFAGSWDGTARSVKNQWEVKEGKRFLVEGNVIEYATQDGQNGAIIVTKVSNPGAFSYTQAETSDITFRYNWVRESCRLWDFIDLDDPSGPVTTRPTRIDVRHNLFSDWGKSAYTDPTSNAFGLTFTGFADIVLDHNTVVTPSSGLAAINAVHVHNGGTDIGGFKVNNNLFASTSTYVLMQDGAQATPAPQFGTNVLETYAPGYEYVDNVLCLQGADPSIVAGWFPTTSEYPSTMAAIQMVDAAGGNYRLSASSPYKGMCADGSDPGADIDTVMLAVGGVAA